MGCVGGDLRGRAGAGEVELGGRVEKGTGRTRAGDLQHHELLKYVDK